MDYERREIDVIDRSDRSDLLSEVNPALNVPTLVLDDGRPLAESNAILWYMGLDTKYLPNDDFDRAKVLQWMFFEQYSHEPNIAVVRYWVSIAAAAPRESVIEARRKAGYEALDAMELRRLDPPIRWQGAKPGMDAVRRPQMGPQEAEIPRVCWFSNHSPRLKCCWSQGDAGSFLGGQYLAPTLRFSPFGVGEADYRMHSLWSRTAHAKSF